MRIFRTEMENKRIGFPLPAHRLEILEEIVAALATAAGVDKTKLDTLISKMDQMDIDFPDSEVKAPVIIQETPV